jgi:predicted nucleotide-binding protein (sugar kinase/HSP70/actin superfamily)
LRWIAEHRGCIVKVIIPVTTEAWGELMLAAFHRVGIEAEITPLSDAYTLELGSRYTSGDECLPAKITVGDFMKYLERPGINLAETSLFMPTADGPCRFGMYAPYLRSVLDAHGYSQVGILSPSSKDGYASLGKLARPFTRTAWRAAVISDILEKLRLMTRPYEETPGRTDRTYRAAVNLLRCKIESAPLRPRSQLEDLCVSLMATCEIFQQIPARREPRPLIGVVGEIFCRLTPFSNQDLIRRLEEAGGEAWLSGFCEWIHYVTSEQQRQLKLQGRGFSRQMLTAWITAQAQKLDERALLAPFTQDFASRPEPEIEEVLEAARPYLPQDGAFGEMVLNVGNVVSMAKRGVAGVIDISPFTCMNGVVSEAIYPRLSRDLGGLPIRSLYFDGTPLDLESELGIFLDMARTYQRRHPV